MSWVTWVQYADGSFNSNDTKWSVAAAGGKYRVLSGGTNANYFSEHDTQQEALDALAALMDRIGNGERVIRQP